jgi:uncharacterized protein
MGGGQQYTVFNGTRAGMMAGKQSLWSVYFHVVDVDAVAKKAASLGARTETPPTDIPGVGRFAVIRDPQGAVFALLDPKG